MPPSTAPVPPAPERLPRATVVWDLPLSRSDALALPLPERMQRLFGKEQWSIVQNSTDVVAFRVHELEPVGEPIDRVAVPVAVRCLAME